MALIDAADHTAEAQATPLSQRVDVRAHSAPMDPALLNDSLAGLSVKELLHKVLLEIFPGRVAVVSSFGAEAAALLDLVSRVDRDTPIIFMDTGKHFQETLDYRDMLIERLRLTNVQSFNPLETDIQAEDPNGTLWERDTDACCDIRKVRPLDRALQGYDAWISGRKRYQSSTRANLPTFESDDGRIKINPLADWDAEQIDEHYMNFGLPRHPLFYEGYPSIGCANCTSKPKPGEDARSGRWAGNGKTECGIHKMRFADNI
ncbi:phosphoadenylyl-sulfate reductase [Aestuariispira insulae]|uniref:Adenosine 5'-phosphosulfate reductase n=1 Tax=Aestuariispira insulae TaxID=1461337 RepID=A0A3D9HEZ1_9PROT|nr:phosphoadenylyl-sulfate reductase [Aestuariispira insulae]RED48044.1 phosphoadenylylsulfate reductase (thioredoxin) [Aestuariispira insulae]